MSSKSDKEAAAQLGCGLFIVICVLLFILFVCLGVLPWLWHMYATYWQWVCR